MQDRVLAAEEAKRCVTELGLAGIQISSHVGEKNLDHESFYLCIRHVKRVVLQLWFTHGI